MQEFELSKEHSFRDLHLIKDNKLSDLLSSIDTKDLYDALMQLADQGNKGNSSLSAFKDGEKQLIQPDKLIYRIKNNETEKLNYSLRVTNIQNLLPCVRSITSYLFNEFEIATSCNLYCTPNSDSNCFTYHSDHQESIIFQIQGRKEWQFGLQNNNSLLREINYGLQSSNPKKNKTVKLEKGNILAIPHSAVHRVQHRDDQVAIHLTFCVYKKNTFDFINQTLQQIAKSKIELIDRSVNKENLSEAINQFIEDLNNIDKDSLINEFINHQELDQLMFLKRGRPY